MNVKRVIYIYMCSHITVTFNPKKSSTQSVVHKG